MSVRAKFRVVSNEQSGETVSIRLSPVQSGSEENKEFFKYTPGGEIHLSVVNPAASEQFKIGEEMYVDFTPAT
jgi:hypothetical protein